MRKLLSIFCFRWTYLNFASFLYLRKCTLSWKVHLAWLWSAKWTYRLMMMDFLTVTKFIANISYVQYCTFQSTTLYKHSSYCSPIAFYRHKEHSVHASLCLRFFRPFQDPSRPSRCCMVFIAPVIRFGNCTYPVFENSGVSVQKFA